MTDFNGDGTTQDPLPGTLNGAFGRQVHAGGLNALLTQYNNTYADQPNSRRHDSGQQWAVHCQPAPATWRGCPDCSASPGRPAEHGQFALF